MQKDSRIYIAGHSGLVGSGLCRALCGQGYTNVITRSHAELDLTDLAATEAFFRVEKPQYVFLAAALAGGIHRNQSQPAEMLRVNLAIQNSVIHAAWRCGVEKLLFIGSACAYPRDCPQPIGPELLLTGPLEPTNEPFALAKIAGIRMCRAYNRQYGTRFICAISATVYGPGDHFDDNGHVAAALMGRFHAARQEGRAEVAVWGTGKPRRELLFVDDLAEALIFLMDRYEENELINVGSGQDVSIAELAELIRQVVGFEGGIVFDTDRPDGMPRRLLDSSRIGEMGFRPRTSLADGLRETYAWYIQHVGDSAAG